ncbi:hypothetical protein BFP97_06350 [Roseivirga sp. 4D4]|uniref:calcium-binding protein n=1 Tax=Roseivirga sp. 4D4 TaxID=1889784 RepID=UPI0008531596|nr:calcium-binding protein [Roseivirga sp. 4D4]OEK01152.1 hypothetical protein BFP97_06350 [Roseivirga sp. 4D4]
MSGKIYITSTSAGIVPNAHTYLVYDLDGDLSTFNDQTMINAGPDNQNIFDWGDIFIDSDLDVQDPLSLYKVDTDGDGVVDNDPLTDYNYTELDLGGASAALKWSDMVAFANQLALSDPISYNPIGANSNSITSSVLAKIGLDFEFNTPHEDGTGAAFSASNYPGYNILFSGIEGDVLHGYGGDDTITDVGGGNDTFFGDEGDDELYGEDGNDTLNGGTGDDELFGGADNDTLNGGLGTDLLEGGTGDDEYIFNVGHGQDEIDDSAGTNDTITIGAGISVADVDFTQLGLDLKITFDGSTDEILIKDHLSTGKIENIQFEDELISNPSAGAYNVVNGTSGNNFFLNGSTGKDIINGFQGDDKLYGDDGDDILNGGDGFDQLYGGAGNDILRGGTDNKQNWFNDGYGDDESYGGAGSDVFIVAPGSDYYDGGAGFDSFTADDQNATTIARGLLPLLNGINVDLSQGLIIDDGYGTSDTVVSVRDVTGSSFSDTLTATSVASSGNFGSRFFARGGDDTLNGNIRNDQLSGEAGNDVLYGAGGNDSLSGGTGNDEFIFNSGDGQDFLVDEDGNDFIRLGAGITQSDITLTQVGDDLEITFANNASDKITVFKHYDTSFPWAIEKIVFNDNSEMALVGPVPIQGTSGDDTLVGTTGDDLFEGSLGNDSIDGLGGIDTVSYASAANAVIANLNNGTVTGSGTDTLSNIENLEGSDYNDTIFGSSGSNELFGGAGNDNLKSYAGDDIAFGGEGADKVYGHGGNDILYGDGDGTETYAGGNDTLYGSSGNDTLYGGGGNDDLRGELDHDTIYGGDGNDRIYGEKSGNTSWIGHDFLYGEGGNDTIYGNSGDDYLSGGTGDDGLHGDAGNDTLEGGDGNDNLKGGAGNDILRGQDGNDILFGGAGDDTLDGGAGTDIADFGSSNAAVTVNLINGTATGEGTDTLTNIEGVYGSDFNDTITGNSSDNDLRGEAGNDVINGEAGNDNLRGGAGNDFITGGAGNDELRGDGGADTFIFEAGTSFGFTDIIRSFETSQNDAIDIADLLMGYDPLTDLITDFVEITDNGTDSTLKVDSDGGADNFVAIAEIYGVTGWTDEAALETAGTLITV